MSERDKLIEELGVKLNMLTQKYEAEKKRANELEQTERLLREQNDLLQKNLLDMKSAKVFAVGNQDIKNTRRNINLLISEIDKCIALLSV